jgi:hypothetical protein
VPTWLADRRYFVSDRTGVHNLFDGGGRDPQLERAVQVALMV